MPKVICGHSWGACPAGNGRGSSHPHICDLWLERSGQPHTHVCGDCRQPE